MCLSSDNFNTFYFGTVAGVRDPRKLTRGEFQLKFDCGAVPEMKPFVRYVMVESPVYFEVSFFLSLSLNNTFGIFIMFGIILLTGISA